MKRAAFVFTLLTVAMTWPLARHLASVATQHQDVYFNMWRLGWIAHALVISPSHLFDANIFYPEPDTLALSDAMAVEGVLAAPLLWAGVKPVLVHNIMLLLPIAASGVAMFALARHLTGSRGAGLIAGVAFAYAPYRYEHLMHMELQWTVWMPLALLALHRTLETGRWTYGLAAGAAVALQMLSSIYYGIFLATIGVPLAAVLLMVPGKPAVPWRKAAGPLAAGAVLALVVCAVYAAPYLRQHARVGDREIADVGRFSATATNYLDVPVGNLLYGNEGRPGRGERRLFPGAMVTLLAIVGLVLRRPSRVTLVYLLLLVAAFEASLGYHGFLYPLLQRLVPAFRSLRAMARLGIFVVMALSVLAGFGYAALVEGRSALVRRTAVAVIAAVMLAEYATRLTFVEFANTPPPLYRVLEHLPRGVVAELPVPAVDRLPGYEAEHAYMSTFHWFALVNGYSGNYPKSYLVRLESLGGFPDERSLNQLRHDGVRYLIVNRASYTDAQLDEIRAVLAAAGMTELGRFDSWGGPALLYTIR